jgi:hypothetical protein
MGVIFAYRPCATQLIEVMEQLTEDLDRKNSIDVIYFDFQKAFDTGLCHTSI